MRYGSAKGNHGIDPSARRQDGQSLKKAAKGAPFGWTTDGTPYIGTQYAVSDDGKQFASVSTRNGGCTPFWKALADVSKSVALSAMETHGSPAGLCGCDGPGSSPSAKAVAAARAHFIAHIGAERFAELEGAAGAADDAGGGVSSKRKERMATTDRFRQEDKPYVAGLPLTVLQGCGKATESKLRGAGFKDADALLLLLEEKGEEVLLAALEAAGLGRRAGPLVNEVQQLAAAKAAAEAEEAAPAPPSSSSAAAAAEARPKKRVKAEAAAAAPAPAPAPSSSAAGAPGGVKVEAGAAPAPTTTTSSSAGASGS